jgi:hypothetical protein
MCRFVSFLLSARIRVICGSTCFYDESQSAGNIRVRRAADALRIVSACNRVTGARDRVEDWLWFCV